MNNDVDGKIPPVMPFPPGSGKQISRAMQNIFLESKIELFKKAFEEAMNVDLSYTNGEAILPTDGECCTDSEYFVSIDGNPIDEHTAAEAIDAIRNIQKILTEGMAYAKNKPHNVCDDCIHFKKLVVPGNPVHLFDCPHMAKHKLHHWDIDRAEYCSDFHARNACNGGNCERHDLGAEPCSHCPYCDDEGNI